MSIDWIGIFLSFAILFAIMSAIGIYLTNPNLDKGEGLLNSTIFTIAMITIGIFLFNSLTFLFYNVPKVVKNRDKTYEMTTDRIPMIGHKVVDFKEVYGDEDYVTKESAFSWYFYSKPKNELDERVNVIVLGTYEDELYFKIKNEDKVWRTNKYESFKDTKSSSLAAYSIKLKRDTNYDKLVKWTQRKYKYPELVLDEYSKSGITYSLKPMFKSDKEVEDYIKKYESENIFLEDLTITNEDTKKEFVPTKEEFDSSWSWQGFTDVKVN